MKIINSVLSKRSRLIGLLLIMTSLGLLLFTQGYDASKDEMVVISTEYGDITVGLYKNTPIRRQSFMNLVKDSYYDSLLFHRVLKGFMIHDAQAGQLFGSVHEDYSGFTNNSSSKGTLLASKNEKEIADCQLNSTESRFYIVDGNVIETNKSDLFVLENQDLGYPQKPYNSKASVISAFIKERSPDADYTVCGEIVDGKEIIDLIAFQPGNGGSGREKDIKMSMKIIKQRWP